MFGCQVDSTTHPGETIMTTTTKPKYKTRSPNRPKPEPGEPVWGNGCEMRGCREESSAVFIRCEDGEAREFCAEHRTNH